MKVNLYKIKYYFLTCDPHGRRKHHIINEFSEHDITEINPILNIGKYKSGASGFSKMIDKALRDQDKTVSFQPFILLEDDNSKYRKYPEYIDIPDNTDILYVGLSICGIHKDSVWSNTVYMKDVNDDIVRIFNMLSSHGIMICSAAGAAALQRCMMEAYYDSKPWDIYMASIQPYYNIYALKTPLVYQDACYGGFEKETRFTLNSVVDSELPNYHYIDTVSVIMSNHNKPIVKALDMNSVNKIYCFWTGNNEMSVNRKESLASLINVSQCQVILVTKDNINEYILSDHPLHPAYEYLSETHKSDYLRTYFMNFHGGGYSDVKKTTGSWTQSFIDLSNNKAWICGYKEIPGGVAFGPGDRWVDLIGNGAYICKPQSPLTEEWYTEMISLLDTKLERLKLFPAKHPQDCDNGYGEAYPIQWNEMLGRIFHKVAYKYKDRILNTLPISIFSDYR